jgi:hypothetical protein
VLQLLATALLTLGSATVAPADTSNCVEAARFLRADPRIHAIVETDTIDDWRTHKHVPGCRITSAGATGIGVQAEALKFFERLRAAKWTRTPDPIDSPNEASLRFRWEKSDCLFNFGGDPLLNTDAETIVNDQLKLRAGDKRFQVYVMCMPAMPASGEYLR